MTKKTISDSLSKQLAGYLPQLVVLFVAVVGFYFTTRVTIASNTNDIHENKTEIKSLGHSLSQHEKDDMSKSDFMEMKADLIRELENTQVSLKTTNQRLDKLIFQQIQE